jgi:Ca2+-binding EF-hand superfamily protein
MKKSVMTGLLVSGLLCSSLALAQGGTDKFMQFFDTNRDGIVTLDEFEAAMQARFARMDSDHNGVVSQEEFRSYLQQRRLEHKQERLKAMDSNGDGQISKQEYLAYQSKQADARFGRLDQNHDGILSADELDNDRRHGYHGGKGLFRKLDSNGDGVISQDENRAALSAWFARIDSNGDKVVTSDEVKAFRDQRHTPKSSQ